MADKRGHEVDFVLARRGRPLLAIECKWSARDFDWTNLRAFLGQYPCATALVVARDVTGRSTRRSGEVAATFVGIADLIEIVAAGPRRAAPR